MLRRRHDPARPVTIELDGVEISADEGEPLAAAIMAALRAPIRRSPVDGSPRAPYCLMGVCFECVVEVDGVPGRLACLTPVAAGMRVRRSLEGIAGDRT